MHWQIDIIESELSCAAENFIAICASDNDNNATQKKYTVIFLNLSTSATLPYGLV